MEPVTIMKFGGSTLGEDGACIGKIVHRISTKIESKNKVVAVFSAPLIRYRDKVSSMTDVAMHIGKNYAQSNPIEIDVLREVYENIASNSLSAEYYKKFSDEIKKFHKEVIISLKQAAENRRFVDVTRSRTLAYSGEIPMSYLMDYILKSNEIKSDHTRIEHWPIITDDNFEAANFLIEESRKKSTQFYELIENNNVVTIGGFIGKTVDGLETTFERGGSDRSAADVAILLNENYKPELDFEKDNAVFSADPKIVKKELDSIKFLSYNEARLAGMFGMKILDPIAIKEIDNNNMDIPIVITNMNNTSNTTTISKISADQSDNLVKIVTGKRNCAIARIESIAASHLLASLESDKQYHEFLKLSPYKKEGVEITRILFLDGDYVRRNEHHFKAYYSKAEIVYDRGVVTLIGDNMWKMPKIASTTSSTVGEHGINILNLDAQEETSRILIIVDDSKVGDAIRAIHDKRNRIDRDEA
ncbi:MAG TPA: aspartate kinase [Nitrososphaeraceae archaeon]|nr:aspartate kinase [Nitrososphaeraceae archaeon]